jgi:predicted ATPase
VNELPRGTLTFLFSDVEGSTHLVQARPGEYADLLHEHRKRLQGVFAAHGGFVMGTEGDSFFVVFRSARDALRAAAAARRTAEGIGLRVRIGLHTGEAETRGDDLYGLDVNQAARIAAAAHGGQILLSQATRALTDPGVAVLDLGEHRLKIHAPVRIFQLGREPFPPIRSHYQSSVPSPATPIIGRTQALEDLRALLEDASIRVVSLVGAGGSGKTRLAAELASQVTTRYPDGVWWTALAPVRHHDAAWAMVAQKLRARDPLTEHLANRRALLCLDNQEHLPGLAHGISRIVASCPGVQILVTSREPAGVAGEWLFQVEPLPIGDAVELFLTRSTAAGSHVERNETVVELCRRLDGLPLAVELAAARTPSLPVDVILARIREDLPVLGRASEGVAKHQRTLDATLNWSYDLLTPTERRVFASLAIFVGGCTLDAASAVCDADIDVLGSLIDKQLVRRRSSRYLMLETTRSFARLLLSQHEHYEDVRRRHSEWCASLCDRHHKALMRGDNATALEVIEEDQHNIRAAISRCVGRGDHAQAVRMAATFWAFQEAQGQITDGERVISEVLAVASDDDLLAPIEGALDPQTYTAAALYGASRMAGWRGESARHVITPSDSSGSAGALTPDYWTAVGLRSLGQLELQEDPDRARTYFLEALELLANPSSDWEERLHDRVVLHLAAAALLSERVDEATRITDEYLRSARGRRPDYTLAEALANAAVAALRSGDTDVARRSISESLEVMTSLTPIVHDHVLVLAAACAGSDPKLAARLLGRAEAAAHDAHTAMGTDLVATRGLLEETSEALVDRLGESRFRRLQRAGSAAPLEALLKDASSALATSRKGTRRYASSSEGCL